MSEADFIGLNEPGSSKTRPVRKERVNTTVFVSSLPYNATSTDLLTHFSFIGPVRHGFVATDKDTGKSKGVGYVTYSLKEDADRAVAELDGGEFGDKGRKIRVTTADKKPPPPPRGERPEPSSPKKSLTSITTSTESSLPQPSDPNAIRTLILSGLPTDITKSVLWKKVRKSNDQVELVYPVEGEEDAAHLIFPSHGDALKALPKLHGHVYKGALLSCVLKKRVEKLSAKGEGKSPSHAGRLIVRNLSWDTTVLDLRATFLPYGPIHSINLPTLPSILPASADPSKPPPPPRARGFAFVWFLVRKDAERAMEGVNGKVIKKAGEKGKVQMEGKEGRPVAVDWALSKEKWEENQKAEGGEGKEQKETEKGNSGSGNSESEESDNDDDDEEEESEQDSDKEVEDVEMVEEQENEHEEPVKPKLPTVDVGSTLFIRNLPFEVTEQELGALFKTFGPLRYARVTMDHATGRSRGSGFVCFWNVEHADQAIREAEKVAQETGANAQPLGGGKNPFALPSILTADPSSSLASRLVLHGRTLEVSRAVTREQASQMKEDGERARERGDKRNTYLMREGVIFPNSPAAANLPTAEIEKRQAAFTARKTLLKSNPSLYISKTRLSIRQLPLFASDRTLKRLAIHAVRVFDEEVAAGTREGLSRVEETDETLSPALAARTAAGKGAKSGKKKKERETPVVQSKVVRQTEKLDPLTGMGKSKGYGFLEMRSHKEALKVLRWANNNPEVGALMWDWWKVEMGELVEKTRKAVEAKKGKGITVAEESDEAEDTVIRGKDEKGKESKKVETLEELEQRLKKLEGRVLEGDDRSSGGMRGGKTLMIEFSVENIQVVKRRVERVITPRTERSTGVSGQKRKADQIEAVDTDDENAPPTKSRPAKGGKKDKEARDGETASKGEKRDRKSSKKEGLDQKEKTSKGEKRGLEKMGDQLGSMIGRKRKMRKGGK